MLVNVISMAQATLTMTDFGMSYVIEANKICFQALALFYLSMIWTWENNSPLKL